MKMINKINLLANTVDQITVFPSAFTRKLDEMDIDTKDALIKVCAECPKDEEIESLIRSRLTNMVANGYILDGKTYVPFMAGASDARKATTSWLREDLQAEIGKWAMCGLKTSEMKLAINKYMAYIGLLTSASKPFAEVFGKALNIRRVAIIKDAEVEVESLADIVSGDSVLFNRVRKVKINAFDGFGVVNRVVTKGESCTIRGPWLKAFVQAVDFGSLADFCKSRGISANFVDFWGKKVDLQNVDMILTESCFKTAKLYQNWDQYCTAFEELGHELAVCVREHGAKLKGMPYQQGQTLMGTADDAIHFMNHAKRTVHQYTDPKNAVKLLSGSQRAAAKLYPALLNEPHTARAIQEKYETKINDMKGGRIPELGYNAFIAPDLKAFAEHLFGFEIKGMLKAGECACASIDFGLVDITRNPHLDNAHVLLNNVRKMVFVGNTPTMFINIWDMTTIRLRCDYDGDHVWFSQDANLLDLVQRTYETLKNIPIDWDVASSQKVAITKSAIAGFIVNLIHGSEIGLYADALTKMWNSGYDKSVCNWLTYAGNVLIDAAKHASVKIVKPDAVRELDRKSLPLFAMYAKADMEHPAETEYWTAPRISRSGKELPPRCAYTGSFLDQYSKLIREEIPEKLTVDGIESEIFDSTKLLINPNRKIGNLAGLSRKGTWDNENRVSVGAGVFQEIAFRHSEEWKLLVASDGKAQERREWEEEVGKAARKEIIAWARSRYPELNIEDEKIDDACYDIIARNIFNIRVTKATEGYDTVIKQAFWRIYGDKAVQVLKKNLDRTIPDFDSEEFADLFADDDDED